MSLYKRGSVYWIRFTAPDGREIRETAQTADRRQAQEYHDRRKAACWRVSRLGERPQHTWQEAVVRWLEEHPERKGISTVLYHLRAVDVLLGGALLNEIDLSLLARVVQQRRTEGLQPSTIRLCMNLISGVLHAAQSWGWLDSVPKIPVVPVAERRIRWLTHEEADRLIAELPLHLAAMCRFSLATGLRESNVCGLEWNQIDLQRRVGWFYGDQMKGKRALGIPLNGAALAVLREQQDQHPRWVFPFRGHRVNRACDSAWRSALKRAGIENFRWHDLRHTWASWHVQASTPLPVLKELGGWASLDMVMRYAHLGVEHLQDHAERINAPRLIRTISGTPTEKEAING